MIDILTCQYILSFMTEKPPNNFNVVDSKSKISNKARKITPLRSKKMKNAYTKSDIKNAWQRWKKRQLVSEMTKEKERERQRATRQLVSEMTKEKERERKRAARQLVSEMTKEKERERKRAARLLVSEMTKEKERERKRAARQLVSEMTKEKERERKRAARQLVSEMTKENRVHLTKADTNLKNEKHFFDILCEEDKLKIEEKAKLQFIELCTRKICLVTDLIMTKRECTELPLKDLPLKAMKKLLANLKWCTKEMYSEYDCSMFDEQLAGMLLSPRAIFKNQTNNEYYCFISTDCLQYLLQIENLIIENKIKNKKLRVPKFSIADKFVYGDFEIFKEATNLEMSCCNLAQTSANIEVIYGSGSMLKSHFIVWDNSHATVASSLPQPLTHKITNIVFTSKLSSQQKVHLLHKHSFRPHIVRKIHEKLIKINPLVKNIPKTPEKSSLGTIDDISLTLDGNDEATKNLIRKAQEIQTSFADTCVDNQIGEHQSDINCLESRTMIIDTTIPEGIATAKALTNLLDNQNITDPTFVAYRASSLLTGDDPKLLEKIFTCLFPFGIGGLSDNRDHHYTDINLARHYLLLSTQSFAKHPTFPLLLFDIIGKKSVLQKARLVCKSKPNLTEAIGRLSADDIIEIAKNDKLTNKKLFFNLETFPEKEQNDLVTALTSVCQARMGSNEERYLFQQLLDNMIIFRGNPSLFFTFTPKADCSLIVDFWNRNDLIENLPSTDKLTSFELPTASHMAALISKNPVTQALYYQACVDTIFEVFFNFDLKNKKAKEGKGLFGRVEALYVAPEQQSRLRIHCHGVAWIEGFPKSVSQWEKYTTDSAFLKDLVDYVTSITCSEYPIYEFSDKSTPPCPICQHPINECPIPKKYFHYIKKETKPPVIGTCTNCKKSFTNNEILELVMKMHQIDDTTVHDKKIAGILNLPGGLSKDKKMNAIEMTNLLKNYQTHSFTHTFSCIKSKRNKNSTVCRFKYPRNLVSKSRLIKKSLNFQVEKRRRLGNAWLNDYIPYIQRVFHFNHDARFLIGAKECLYGAKYSSKPQNTLDNIFAMKLALSRKIQRECLDNNESQSDFHKGLRRLMSMAISQSGVIELGSPLITLFLLAGIAGYFSDTFAPVMLTQALNLLEKGDLSCPITRTYDINDDDHNIFAPTAAIYDYIYRPHELETYNLYDFVHYFEKVRKSDKPEFSFSGNWHPQFNTHGLKKRCQPVVPRIIGPRMPDQNSKDENHVELYSKVALLLYHPFRDPADEFLKNKQSCSLFFENWIPSSTIRKRLDYHQQYHLSVADDKKYREEQKQRELELQCEDNDILNENPESDTGAHSINCINIEPLYTETIQGILPLDNILDQPFVDEEIDTISHVRFSNNPTCNDDSYIENDNILPTVEISKKDLKNHASKCFKSFGLESIDENDDNDFSIIKNLNVPKNREIVLKLINTALEMFVPILNTGNNENIENKIYPSFNEVSNYFHLNEKQHQAFVSFSIPIFAKIFGLTIEDLPKLFTTMSPIILLGSGSAGKSLVIKAIQFFFKQWGRPNAILALAPTGVAASNIKGKTIHSAFAITPPIPTKLPDHIAKPSKENLNIWKGIHGVIIDEISMMDKKMFGFLISSLYKLKETSNSEKWPNIKLLLSGDFFQLSPTSSTFLFKEPSKHSSELVKFGYKMYRQIKNVIYLKESHRFKNDQEWGNLLNKARLGEWSDEIKNILKERHQAGIKSNIQQDNDVCNFIPIISPENLKRQKVNNACIQKIASNLTVYKLPAIIQGANERQLAELLTLSDDKTSRIPPILYFYIGMPIKFRSNQCVPAMLANGTCGTIYHVQWREGTTFITDGPYKIPSKPPLNMYIKINGPNQPPIKYPNLPNSWPINVLPIRRETRKITYFKKDNNEISINNYPVIPAFGVTAHLVQGLTLPKIIITEPLPKRQKPDKHGLYLTLSRCPTREGVFLANELSDRHYNYFIPNKETINEDNRLQNLDKQLFTSFNAIIRISKQYKARFSNDFISTCEGNNNENITQSFNLPNSIDMTESSDNEETLLAHYKPTPLSKENQKSNRNYQIIPPPYKQKKMSQNNNNYVGFQNNNNTCWLSSTIQSLASISLIDTWLSECTDEIITILKNTITKLKHAKKTVPEPTLLKEALSYKYPQYTTNSQEDVMELMIRIISLVGNGPFHFEIKETAICNNCGHETTKLIPANHIKYTFNNVDNSMRSVEKMMQKTTSSRHSRCEICCSLTDDNQLHSEIITTESYPNLLLINLARFDNDLNKIHSPFQFSPVEHIDKQKYKLRSVICHYGTTLHTGHYISINKKLDSNEFLLYNDSNVSPCINLSSFSTHVYTLIYEKLL